MLSGKWWPFFLSLNVFKYIASEGKEPPAVLHSIMADDNSVT